MGYFTEASQWDAQIYKIETSDRTTGGSDGPVNQAPASLANRTKWLKDTMLTAFDLSGIPTSRVDPVYKGLNMLISDVSFATGVVDGNAVYISEAGVFTKATDSTDYVGIADVTNTKVLLLGLITLPVVGALPGDNIFVSATTAGALTTTETDICIGKYLDNDIICLTNAFGFFRGSFTLDAERILKRTVFIYS